MRPISVLTKFGFVWDTGKAEIRVERWAILRYKGRSYYRLGISTGGCPSVEIMVSEGGKSIRVFRDGKELK